MFISWYELDMVLEYDNHTTLNGANVLKNVQIAFKTLLYYMYVLYDQDFSACTV